jgi:hypothetical protein
MMLVVHAEYFARTSCMAPMMVKGPQSNVFVWVGLLKGRHLRGQVRAPDTLDSEFGAASNSSMANSNRKLQIGNSVGAHEVDTTIWCRRYHRVAPGNVRFLEVDGDVKPMLPFPSLNLKSSEIPTTTSSRRTTCATIMMKVRWPYIHDAIVSNPRLEVRGYGEHLPGLLHLRATD